MPAKMSFLSVIQAFDVYRLDQLHNAKVNLMGSAAYEKATAFNKDTLRERLGPLAVLIEWEEAGTGFDDRGMEEAPSRKKLVEADGVRLHGSLGQHTVHGVRPGGAARRRRAGRTPGTY